MTHAFIAVQNSVFTFILQQQFSYVGPHIFLIILLYYVNQTPSILFVTVHDPAQ